MLRCVRGSSVEVKERKTNGQREGESKKKTESKQREREKVAGAERARKSKKKKRFACLDSWNRREIDVCGGVYLKMKYIL